MNGHTQAVAGLVGAWGTYILGLTWSNISFMVGVAYTLMMAGYFLYDRYSKKGRKGK